MNALIILFLLLLGGDGPTQVLAESTEDVGHRAQLSLAVVDSLITAGRLEKARDLAVMACGDLAGFPRYPDPLENRLAIVYLRLEQFQNALPLLEDGVQRRPNSATAHRNLGACLMAMGKVGRALSSYKEVVQLDPTSHQAHLEYGQILLKLGMSHDALQEFQAASRLCAECSEVDPALAQGLLLAGDPRAALAPLRRLIDSPGGLQFHRNYLKALLDSGADRELVSFLTAEVPGLGGHELRLLAEAEGRLGGSLWSGVLLALAQGKSMPPGISLPDLEQGWDQSALLWVIISSNMDRDDDPIRALEALDLAVTLDQNSSLIRNNRASVLLQLGRRQEADVEWRKAVELDPSLERKTKQ